jgi:putative Holliday junction resolvase
VRILGVDVGRRRIGLAISDSTGTLARPLKTIVLASPDDGLGAIAAEAARLSAEDDGLGRIVVGMPRRLDGRPNDETPRVAQIVAALAAQTGIDVVTEDERLSSVEAESRLARRERDWKKRKAQLDAAAAAVILQDYLDRGHEI